MAKKHALAISQTDDAKLVSVFDKEIMSTEHFKDAYGARVYSDLDKMLISEKIDVVCICTPSGLHAPIALKAIEAQKNVIIDKTIAMTVEEADRIIAACKDKKVKLAVVHQKRFRPAVQEVKRILDEGLLGKISHANFIINWNRNKEYYSQASWRGTKENDGGVLMNQAIHLIDLLIWFLGIPKQVFCMQATRFHNIES